MSGTDAKPAAPGKKLLIDFGPLLLFFVVYVKKDIFWATGAFMILSVAVLAYSWFTEHKLPTMLLVSSVLVLVLGGLTIALHDETFIKLKLTVVNALFGLILLGGLAFGKPLIKPLLGTAIRLTDEGWKRFTLCWVGYFAFVACLNEVVWRNTSTDFWVKFKVFGILPLTFLFFIALMPMISRYEIRDEE
ncbi:MAG: septation protein A [Planctomycetota bacterium]|nr:septation protein A [Planctomycetota bacterium]